MGTLVPLDQRTYAQLRSDALARIPSHLPEWTNPSVNDPGVAIIELVSHLTESLIYFAGQGALRCREVFFDLLGLRRREARAATGLMTLASAGAELAVHSITRSTTVRAGALAFRMSRGFDLLPVAGAVFVKRTIEPTADEFAYYQSLYALGNAPSTFYETIELGGDAPPTPLATTTDRSVWIALVVRTADARAGVTAQTVAAAIAGRTLTVGLAPLLPDDPSSSRSNVEAFNVSMPNVEVSSPRSTGTPTYRLASSRQTGDPNRDNVLLEIDLPPAEQLTTWAVDPLEAGVGGMPPSLEETDYADRVITWIKLTATSDITVSWIGVNTTIIEQVEASFDEPVLTGDGTTDQSATLRHAPVVSSSVDVLVTTAAGTVENWPLIDQLGEAPGERTDRVAARRSQLDAATGRLSFGDGITGARLPTGATVTVTYHATRGAEGNLPAHSFTEIILGAHRFKADNPMPTTGGADAETVEELQRRTPSLIRSRDRLISVDDGVELTMATPGVDLGRVDVLPAYHPDLPALAGGTTPGTITVLVVPTAPISAAVRWPRPTGSQLRAIYDHLETRRLITTELIVRGPIYLEAWVSVSFACDSGVSTSDTAARIRDAVAAFLSPLPIAPEVPGWMRPLHADHGWPVGAPVRKAELIAIVSRVPGVRYVNELLLAGEGTGDVEQIALQALLQLPELRGVAAVDGPAVALADLKGWRAAAPVDDVAVAIPVVPEAC